MNKYNARRISSFRAATFKKFTDTLSGRSRSVIHLSGNSKDRRKFNRILFAENFVNVGERVVSLKIPYPLNANRVAALKESGIWFDNKLREKIIRAYVEADRKLKGA